MKFLQELDESRLYRRLSQTNGKSVEALVEKLFEHLLVLQVLANVDPKAAANYSEQILRHRDFAGFRTSMPDLYNLIVLTHHADRFPDLTKKTDTVITIPDLILRRNLGYIAQKRFNNDDFSRMMIILQNRFTDFIPDQLKTLRRQISRWKFLSASDKQTVLKRLRFNMREVGIQSDFFEKLNTIIR